MTFFFYIFRKKKNPNISIQVLDHRNKNRENKIVGFNTQ